MSLAAWIMLATTWTVIISFTVYFYAKALGRRARRSEKARDRHGFHR